MLWVHRALREGTVTAPLGISSQARAGVVPKNAIESDDQFI